jgi:aspartate aminotransferase
MNLSERMQRLRPSATNAMSAKVKAMKAEGRSVVSFTTGEPDFNTPEAAVNAATEAMKKGKTHYTVTGGVPELKKAIIDYYKKRFNLDYSPKEVMAASGAKPLVYESLGCLINPGNEVILFAPAWVSYYEQIRLFEGKPVILNTENTNFLPDPDQFEKLITDKTVAVILNNPNNPTGTVYPSDLLKKIVSIAIKHNLIIINDEIYERLYYGADSAKHILQLIPEARDYVLNINGVSKSYAMTGWRLGYALGPEKLIKAMTSMQGHITSCPSSISQWAAVGAINEAEDDVERMRKVFEKRRDLTLSLLSQIPCISFKKPEGAFYVYVNVSAIVGTERPFADDIAFCEAILQEKGLGLVPGTAFLCPGFVRISYSCSDAQIKRGLELFKSFVEEYVKN